MKNIIVAYANHGAIGAHGRLLWQINQLRDDMDTFKRLTTGKAVIMGRKTFESIGRPLPNRRNIVITRNDALQIPGVTVVTSLESTYDLVGEEDCFVIGGGEIYKQALKSTDRIYATEVEADFPEVDTFFPELSSEWQIKESRVGKVDGQNIYPHKFVVYER